MTPTFPKLSDSKFPAPCIGGGLFLKHHLLVLEPVAFAVDADGIGVMQQPVEHRRITLEIDPTLKPQQVALVYKQVRGKLITSRYRSQKKKHLTMAKFYSKQPEGVKPARMMNAWNETCEIEKWKYSHSGKFNDECKTAYSRLLNPGFER